MRAKPNRTPWRQCAATVVVVLGAAGRAPAAPYADFVFSYLKGPLTESPVGSGNIYDDPAEALGAQPLAAPTVPTGRVVQLGQGGSLTLGFTAPIVNKAPGAVAGNPSGADFVVFGNAFEQGFAGSGSYYREPGFVEVAARNPDGTPGPFYLLLPEVLPAALQVGTHTGPGALLPAGYADVRPVDGSGNALIAPEQLGSAGGDAFYLESAVLQASPGVPLLDGLGSVQYASVGAVGFVRITDALPNDSHPLLGGFTTDVDAVVNLPTAVPEPGMLSAVAAAFLFCGRRRSDRRSRG